MKTREKNMRGRQNEDRQWVPLAGETYLKREVSLFLVWSLPGWLTCFQRQKGPPAPAILILPSFLSPLPLSLLPMAAAVLRVPSLGMPTFFLSSRSGDAGAWEEGSFALANRLLVVVFCPCSPPSTGVSQTMQLDIFGRF